MIKFFESPAALRELALQTGIKSNGEYNTDSNPAFFGRDSLATVLQKTLTGDESLVPAAQKYIDQLDVGLVTKRKQWEPTVAGPRAHIVDYLRGVPTCMRRLDPTLDETAPINVLVCVTASAGFTATQLAARGTAILALVQALTASRAVTLRVICTLDGRDASGETILVTTINTTPLDLATACHVLTNTGFDRRLHFHCGQKLNGYRGGWARGYHYSDGGESPFIKALPGRLGFDPSQTLIVPPVYIRDPLMTDPLAWIQKQLSRFTANQEDSE